MSGEMLAEAMRQLSLRHAELLLEMGPVRVLALDPCPRCLGRVIASETEARCTRCDWWYQQFVAGPEPVASRRADP